VLLQVDADDEIGVPASPYIVWEVGLQVFREESTSSTRVGVLYMDPDMSSFLFKY
jgi:hypothetical protein